MSTWLTVVLKNLNAGKKFANLNLQQLPTHLVTTSLSHKRSFTPVWLMKITLVCWSPMTAWKNLYCMEYYNQNRPVHCCNKEWTLPVINRALTSKFCFIFCNSNSYPCDNVKKQELQYLATQVNDTRVWIIKRKHDAIASVNFLCGHVVQFLQYRNEVWKKFCRTYLHSPPSNVFSLTLSGTLGNMVKTKCHMKVNISFAHALLIKFQIQSMLTSLSIKKNHQLLDHWLEKVCQLSIQKSTNFNYYCKTRALFH